MIDYEAVKKHFADKLSADFAGQGRFESAFYHTIKMVHDSVAEENAERIALLEKDIKTLCAALSTTSQGNAQLLAENAELRLSLGGMFNEFGELEYSLDSLTAARKAMAKALA